MSKVRFLVDSNRLYLLKELAMVNCDPLGQLRVLQRLHRVVGRSFSSSANGADEESNKEGYQLVVKELKRQERQYNQTMTRRKVQNQKTSKPASEPILLTPPPNTSNSNESIRSTLSKLHESIKKTSSQNSQEVKKAVPLVPPPPKPPRPNPNLLVKKYAMPPPPPPLNNKRPKSIVYPKSPERPAVNFKVFPHPPTTITDKEPKPQTRPKITESSTHRITTLIKHVSVTPSAQLLRDIKTNVRGRLGFTMSSTSGSKDDGTENKKVEMVGSGPVDILGNPIDKEKEQLFKNLIATTTTGTGISGKSDGGDQGSGHGGDGKGGSKDDGLFKSWRAVKYSVGVLGAACAMMVGGVVFVLGKESQDAEGRVVEDEYSKLPPLTQYIYRCWHEIQNYNRLIREPSREKLLPDVLSPPYYQPPYTLVLEFTDLLVHPEWTYETGWRFKKRPGMDQFLEALYTRFEVVVYTAQMGMTVFPILESLDPNNLISYKLVRDATNFVDGDHVKDLDRINRDLRKVVVVDWNASSVKLHAGNLFQIPRWTGNNDDTTLYDLAAFLLAISEWEIEDVRAVLQYYSQFENPLAKFKEAQMQVLQSSQYT